MTAPPKRIDAISRLRQTSGAGPAPEEGIFVARQRWAAASVRRRTEEPMTRAWSLASYCSARAAEERAYAANSRSEAHRLERLAIAEHWDRRATEVDRRARDFGGRDRE
jgi:hypothetical protein